MYKKVDHYELWQMLDKNPYWEVRRAYNSKTKKEVRIEIIKRNQQISTQKLEQLFQHKNFQILSNIKNPHIVQFIELLRTVHNTYMVYEYCPGGTLQKTMENYSKSSIMPLGKALQYFWRVAEGVDSLARIGVVIRNFNPNYIHFHNEIAKFDFLIFADKNVLKLDADFSPGAMMYTAPEVLFDQDMNKKAVIWSLGVTLYHLVFGQCPFLAISVEGLRKTLESDKLLIPFPIPTEVETLIRRMLVTDPAKRIEWAELLSFKNKM